MSTEEKSPVFSKETWPSSRVRQTFIDFFVQQKDHKFVKSSPILPPAEDVTLMFANSGMNQFKPVFMGQCDENHEFAGLTRAANTQKCIRAGGKHNDLEEVGFDVYHHTFFEMLGNWSFGSYFKEEAITWSWQLLTEVFKLPADRLYATYFGGDPTKPGVPADDEAKQIWLRFLPESHILPFNAKDNFWEMGATGPCGPCTEIHFDRIGGRECPELVNMDDPNVLEIWNNVFMQFYCDENGTLTELPAQHVDTGMGFERLTSILQGATSNYDTDIFDPIFAAIRAETKCREYTGKVGADDVDGVDMAYRVVADHVRALTFAITDRIDPDSEGRGYVLRRILRRGVRYGNQFLGATTGFFSRLSKVVSDTMSGAFPELAERSEYVQQVILSEEKAFARSLTRGMKRFNRAVAGLQPGDKLDGTVACNLYSTYGFPIDLTRLMCDEKKFVLSEAECEAELERQKEISRAGEKTADVELKLEALQTDHLAQRDISFTDDASKYDWKTTGTGPVQGATVKALFVGLRSDIQHTVGFVDSVTADVGHFGIVLDRTNFYAESGGQVFDQGEFKMADGTVVQIQNTQSFGGYVLHTGLLHPGQQLAVGAAVTLHVDYERRSLIAKNHTATHLLNFALRKVLSNVDQQGSLVDADKARFDFNFSKAMTSAQILQVQEIVQQHIDEKAHVDKLSCPKEAALEISALRAMFGQSYPTTVRVVAVVPADADFNIQTMVDSPKDEKWFNTSVEFCGGTHLDNVGEAGRFVIISESSIKAGVRRIVAFTGDLADEAIAYGEECKSRFEAAAKLPGDQLAVELKELTALLTAADLPATVQADLTSQASALNKSIGKWKRAREAALEKTAVAAFGAEWAADQKDAKFILTSVDVNGSTKALKKVASKAGKLVSVPILVYSVSDDGAVSVFAQVPAGQSVDAKNWTTAFVTAVGGRSGGNATSSTGQSRDSSNLDAAVRDATAFMTQ
jgi:alanyl-tRNA synthetase